MWGAYIRAALYIAGGVLTGAILQFIVPYMLPYQGPEGSLLYRSFNAVAENAIFIMLIAVGAGLLARAVVESNAGVR